jgi:NadR type nicotinamide-nucleotide adenylyltransferase
MAPDSLLRVALTGSECTGKTRLAVDLATRFETVWVPEAARLVAESKGAPLDESDVEPIARRHLEDARRAEPRARGLIFFDTDLISTVVYSRHYYGSCPAWIEEAARQRLADLYLLHHPDVPWIADSARDRGHVREKMHALFAEALIAFGAHVTDISGSWEERRRIAEAAAREALKLCINTAR